MPLTDTKQDFQVSFAEIIIFFLDIVLSVSSKKLTI